MGMELNDMKKVVDGIRRFARCVGDNGYKNLSARE